MIILASASPRRRELLGRITDRFTVVTVADEEKTDYKRPHLYVQALATHKAERAAENAENGDVVIAADTTVYYNGRVFNKPKDADEAKRFLRTLSGRKHSVYTGVSVIKKGEGRETYYCRSVVELNDLSDAFIDAYVAGGSPLDKAGAYGIQDKGVVRRVIGDYDNVVGLPLQRLKEILGEENGHG